MDRKNNIQNFLKEYKELCKKYDTSLSFWLGELEIENYKEDNFLRIEYEIENMEEGE